jgi:sirohydrochlorin cobaltochelatase
MQTPATPLGTHHGARHEDTILLIGHGSREDRATTKSTALWPSGARASRPGASRSASSNLPRPRLHDGLLAAARSSRRVLVLPLILNAAGHAKMEIPEAIEHAREHAPGVEFLYGPHLSACDPILAILKRRPAPVP